MEAFIGIIVILAIAILLIKRYKQTWFATGKIYLKGLISKKKTTKKKK